jgi:AraC-like DNA-binding protein/quercetin dioxygenase-like cupin family protein
MNRKAQFLKIPMPPAQSFSVRQDVAPSVNNRWHYHPEFELVYFNKGKGAQFIGDNISRFDEGDLVLVGPHLPHYWRFDAAYFNNSSVALHPDVRVVHFAENLWGDAFLDLPENKLLKSVLEKSRRGLNIKGQNKEQVTALISEMPHVQGMDRIIILMQVLAEISKCEKLETFSSVDFHHEKDRINDVYDYSYANFKNKISLEEIAEVAKISPNSFCRYFKSRTRKTYSQFLIEIKVGRACELLIEHSLNLKQVCYDCGFNNFASFYKYFKKVTGKSPLCYQKEFIARLV